MKLLDKNMAREIPKFILQKLNLYVIYDKTYRKNFWFLNFFNESNE